MTLGHWHWAATAGLAVAVAVSIGALAAGPAGAVARVAAPATAARPSGAVPLKLLKERPRGPETAADPLARTTDTCGAVRAKLREYRARGVRRVSCVTVSHPSGSSAGSAKPPTVPRAVIANTPSWCGATLWVYFRTETCSLDGTTVTYQLINADSGAVLGTAQFQFGQDILLQPNSTAFTENDTVSWVSATGLLAVPSAVEFTASCTSGCAAQNGGSYTSEMEAGQTANVAFSYQDTPAAHAQDSFQTSYSFFLLPPDSLPGPTVEWNSPVTIRCDDQLANRSPGCVFPEFTPTLQLSLSLQGAGAANALFGEIYVQGSPGYSTPLTRVANQKTRNAYRNAICYDGTFVPDPFVTNDSCDEYPFASSQQSGAAYGLTGASCLDGVPFLDNGTWYFSPDKNVTNPLCLRGHVPLSQNQAVGSVLGQLILSNRILNGDSYWVDVSA